jgi:uncharacterized protein (TIGR02271 family)
LAESEAARVITEIVETLGEAQTAAALATLKDRSTTSGPTNRSSDASLSVAEKAGNGETKLQLFAEELSLAKETVETGRVRISTHTLEREALVDEDLAHEQVKIETIPVNLQIDAVPEVRQEGDTTIVPVVEERVVVKRRLMLKEEVRIRRVHSTERHRETVKLRYQHAVFTRQEDDA